MIATQEMLDKTMALMATANWIGYFIPQEGEPSRMVEFQNSTIDKMVEAIDGILEEFPEEWREEKYIHNHPMEVAGGRFGTCKALLSSGRQVSINQVSCELYVCAMHICDELGIDNEFVGDENQQETLSAMAMYRDWMNKQSDKLFAPVMNELGLSAMWISPLVTGKLLSFADIYEGIVEKFVNKFWTKSDFSQAFAK